MDKILEFAKQNTCGFDLTSSDGIFSRQINRHVFKIILCIVLFLTCGFLLRIVFLAKEL